MVAYKSEESRLKVLEAQERGRESNRRKAQENRTRYNLNPKKCVCGNIIPYDRQSNKFCSHTCSARSNNPLRLIITKAKRGPVYCLLCGIRLKKNQNKFCSMLHMFEYRKANNLIASKQKFDQGLMNDYEIRRYFRVVSEKKCTICGNTEWNGKPIPLVVDHVDGNSDNGDPSNVRMICCNCDAQLPTYKGANKGNGRAYRRKQ
jgi:hypothetical protein